MKIDCILFDGAVFRAESDEYVRITNYGQTPQNLLGWELRDKYDSVEDGNQVFAFPTSYVLGRMETIRVYTDEIHEEWGGFIFDINAAIWHNEDADTAVLLDAVGNVVDEKSYDVKSPPGCVGWD